MSIYSNRYIPLRFTPGPPCCLSLARNYFGLCLPLQNALVLLSVYLQNLYLPQPLLLQLLHIPQHLTIWILLHYLHAHVPIAYYYYSFFFLGLLVFLLSYWKSGSIFIILSPLLHYNTHLEDSWRTTSIRVSAMKSCLRESTISI